MVNHITKKNNKHKTHINNNRNNNARTKALQNNNKKRTINRKLNHKLYHKGGAASNIISTEIRQGNLSIIPGTLEIMPTTVIILKDLLEKGQNYAYTNIIIKMEALTNETDQPGFEEALLHLNIFANLTDLTISSSKTLKTVPNRCFTIKALKCLSLINCALLETIPSNIKNLEKLQSITLMMCPSLTTLPEELYSLPSLIRINVMGSDTLYKNIKDAGAQIKFTNKSIFIEGINLQVPSVLLTNEPITGSSSTDPVPSLLISNSTTGSSSTDPGPSLLISNSTTETSSTDPNEQIAEEYNEPL